jgi:predicted acyltransferase
MEKPQPPTKRLYSIDVLRGFDMLMICGVEVFMESLEGKTSMPWVDALARQFHHTTWHGFSFLDFIFPLFLFIAGVSIPFSVSSASDKGATKAQVYKKAFRRMIILVVLGIIEKNAPFPFFDWSHVRLVGVLQRIGLAGFITTILFVNFSSKQRIAWVAGILLFYYAVMFLVPVPGFGAGDLSFEGNLHGYIDRHFLPGRLLQGSFDENGLLTQLPALCLTVLGSIAGDIFRNKKYSPYGMLQQLLIFGIVCLGLGLLWNQHFPINKRLWSSSFILLTGGMSFLSLALFYYLIDILQLRKWAFFFAVIGMNSITIYLVYHFVDFGFSSRLLFEGFYSNTPVLMHPVWQNLGAIVLVWVFVYFLYRNKLFLKI